MESKQLDLMVNEIISLLKKKDFWETDVGIIYNGKHVTHKGVEPREENLMGTMRIWYEGPLNHALNYGIGDKKVYSQIDTIMEKYGYYMSPYSASDANVYPIG